MLPIAEVVSRALPPLAGCVVHKARVQNIHLFANSLDGTIPSKIGKPKAHETLQ